MNWEKFEQAFTGQPITGSDWIAALVVIGVGVLLSVFLGRVIRRTLGRPGGQYEQMEKLVARVAQWGVIAISVAWALSILGLDVGWFSLSVLLGLLIVAFSLKPLVESFAISVLIASRPAFGIGDEICVDDIVGEVIEITERSVVLRQPDGVRVHIPNLTVLSKKVAVYSTETDRRSEVELTLASGTDVEHADRVIQAALAEVTEVTEFDSVSAISLSNCVEISIRFWHKPSLSDQRRAIDAVIRSLQQAFATSEIRFAPEVEVQIAGSDGGRPITG